MLEEPQAIASPTSRNSSIKATTGRLDFELSNPELTDSFEVAILAAERPAQLIYEGKRQDLSIETIQTAIWLDEEQVTQEDVLDVFDVSTEEIDAALELLEQTPNPEIT